MKKLEKSLLLIFCDGGEEEGAGMYGKEMLDNRDNRVELSEDEKTKEG